ncbi:MAG: DNA primase, partial [Methanobrevibacter sp.]
FEAADNCTPPLFEDQPQEKINIISKLGFGMHNEVSLEHEGETKWYTPMSCEKVKIHLPQLCKKDKGCKGISNPLSYYTRAKWSLKKEGKIDSESSTGGD